MLKTPELIALEGARDELAAALDMAARKKAALDALKADFERQHMALIAEEKAASMTVAELKVIVREKALAAHAVDGTIKLTDGIGIQYRTQVDYDPAALFAACLQYAPMFLTVNDKAIEALGESAPDDKTKKHLNAAIMAFLPLTIWQKPTATIGDDTLIKLHGMKGAEEIVNAAIPVQMIGNPITPKKRTADSDEDDPAVHAATAALDAVGALG